MERVFIKQTMVKNNSVLVEESEKQEAQLTTFDRCDSCSSQAYIRIKGSTGELYFCGHHYDKIMNDPDAYTKMMSFMLEVLDERWRLEENKQQGKSY